MIVLSPLLWIQILSETELVFNYLSIYNLMDSLEIDTFKLEWQVEAFDSTHSLESINGPSHLQLVTSPPLVPFSLENPTNNQNIFIQMHNILDINFSWSESFNIFEILVIIKYHLKIHWV